MSQEQAREQEDAGEDLSVDTSSPATAASGSDRAGQQEEGSRDSARSVQMDSRFYELIEAMESDNLQKLRELVDSGVPITHRDPDDRSYPLHGGSALHMAARRGNCDQLGVLLAHSTTPRLVNAQDMWEMTPLVYAAGEGRAEPVLRLLQRGADPSLKCGDRRTALHAAAESNDPAALRCLLRGPDRLALAAATDGRGRTPLVCAAESYNAEAVRLLLATGVGFSDPTGSALHAAADRSDADTLRDLLKNPETLTLLDQTDSQGRTALMYAAMRQNADSVRLLIENGAISTPKDRQLRTVLHYAARNEDASALREILTHPSADTVVRDRDETGRTALMFATRKGNIDAFRLLLQKGAVITDTDEDMRTMLHIATESGGVDILREILAHSAAKIILDAEDNVGRTPLLAAVSSGNIDIVRILLDNGARVTDRDKFWCSALHLAAYNGDVAMLRELLKNPHTASLVNDEDDEDFTPLMSAACRGNVEVVRLLLDNGSSRTETFGNSSTIINNTAKMGRTAVLRELLTGPQATYLANLADDKGCTPLMLASGADKILLLLETGARLIDRDRKQRSVLHFSAENTNVEVLREFLRHADAVALVNDADVEGRTPLMVAVGCGNVEAIRLLLGNGARCTDVDSNGRTVLHIAVGDETPSVSMMSATITNTVLQELLKDPKLASFVNVADRRGHTALDYAKKAGNVESVQLLLKNGAL